MRFSATNNFKIKSFYSDYESDNPLDSKGQSLRYSGILFPIRFTNQGYVVLVERFGKYVGLHQPGLNFFIPFVHSIIQIDMREQVYSVSKQEAITNDNVSVSADGVIFFKVIDPIKAAYAVKDLEISLANMVVNNLRTVIGSMELDELLSGRNIINNKLMEVMETATREWGIEVKRIEIRDIKPREELIKAMDSQMTAERERRSEILLAEGHRKSKILQAEADAESIKLTANAQKDAAIAKAEAEKASQILKAEAELESAQLKAQGIERISKAEAESIRLVAEAISSGSQSAANYFTAQKYIESWSKLAGSPNTKLFMTGSNTSGTEPIAIASSIISDAFSEMKVINKTSTLNGKNDSSVQEG